MQPAIHLCNHLHLHTTAKSNCHVPSTYTPHVLSVSEAQCATLCLVGGTMTNRTSSPG